jgi:hypothetical protein
MNIKILVAHHKQGLIIKNDVYLPIHVGKDLSNLELGIQGDNVADNISYLNPLYCEMTAAYWGWKNIHSDYIGLCHYRRYFTFMPMPFKERVREKYRFYKKKIIEKLLDPGSHYSFQDQIIVWNSDVFKNMALAFSDQLKSMIVKKDYDLIVPKPYIETSQNIEQHFREIGIDHIKSLKNVVSESYPEFLPYLSEALASHKLYAANMFIMKFNLYDDYCKLVFDILDLQIKRMVSTRWCIDPLIEGCYSRISGYLAEILTSAYIMKIEKNKGKVLYVNSSFHAV